MAGMSDELTWAEWRFSGHSVASAWRLSVLFAYNPRSPRAKNGFERTVSVGWQIEPASLMESS
jgi:hypothetical protein